LEKRRVYQVAREQKLSSDALISILKGMGYEVKSHMSVVTDEMLEAITRKIEKEKKSSIEEVKRQKAKEESRKKAQATEATTRRRREEQGKSSPRHVGAQGGGRNSAPWNLSTNVPLPVKEDEERKRSRRRSKRTSESSIESGEGGPAEKKEPMKDGGVGGKLRGKRGKRRRLVDTRTIQDNVRKTLSQLSESRTRRHYERSRKDDGEALEAPKQLTVSEFITVAGLAEQMGVKPTEVVAACLELGLMATINQRLDMSTIATVADEFGYEVKPLDAHEDAMVFDEVEDEEEGEETEPRPPVVTVMGHVDHGKTSFLDYLRKSNVVAGESGGITQHIGAYVVRLSDGRGITFLDTPGHAAFTAMRARGARVTDLVILVAAADDQVMPQTIEAIDHSKAAQVPMIVAINKIDLSTADPGRIKRQLAERDVLLEEWGGKVPSAEVSAVTGAGIDKLLELVLLEAELLELKANPNIRASGTIIEAKLDKGRGPVATVLVQKGTLRKGDPFITGVFHGRVRALLDENGQKIEMATPSIPVQVLGLAGVPQAGDRFEVTAGERDAREVSQKRQQLKREQDYRNIHNVSLSDLHYQIQQGQIRELKVIVKGDVDGSVEAITQELGGIAHEEVRVAVIHSGVGVISETDVLLASASNAIILGFGVNLEASAREMALRNSVEIRHYKVIYEVVEEIRAALSGLLSPVLEEHVVGTAQVRQIFTSSRVGTVAGCVVQNGKITRNNRVRVVRGGEVIFKGDMASLRRFKDDVREVLEGYECGIGVEGFSDIKQEDILEVLEVVETVRSLDDMQGR
jgi:translation initiation factor IF-2